MACRIRLCALLAVVALTNITAHGAVSQTRLQCQQIYVRPISTNDYGGQVMFSYRTGGMRVMALFTNDLCTTVMYSMVDEDPSPLGHRPKCLPMSDAKIKQLLTLNDPGKVGWRSVHQHGWDREDGLAVAVYHMRRLDIVLHQDLVAAKEPTAVGTALLPEQEAQEETIPDSRSIREREETRKKAASSPSLEPTVTGQD